uniref:Acyl-coenzyme A thioesterase 13 n=1 Tax=Acrobeloides nanus TaxID=290746 RepID=A0A914EG60_9BILA
MMINKLQFLFGDMAKILKRSKSIYPISASPRSIVVEMTVDREHVNNKGTLHGGQTAALVDIVTARAVAVAHKNVPMASTDLSVSYFLPVRLGEVLVIEGTVLKAGKTMAFTEIEFRRKSDNALIAKGKHNLAFVPIPADKLNNLEPYY